MGYDYYPKTRIFIRHLIKLCLFCPITVTRSTSNVPLSHIGFAQYRPVSSPENSVATLSIIIIYNHYNHHTPILRKDIVYQTSHETSERYYCNKKKLFQHSIHFCSFEILPIFFKDTRK